MQEFDIVRLKETYIDIPAGMEGTIIYVYKNMKAYEVEFRVGDSTKVATLTHTELEKV